MAAESGLTAAQRKAANAVLAECSRCSIIKEALAAAGANTDEYDARLEHSKRGAQGLLEWDRLRQQGARP